MGEIWVNRELIDRLFAPEEFKRWFGTSDPVDDDGTGNGTIIGRHAFLEIERRFYGR